MYNRENMIARLNSLMIFRPLLQNKVLSKLLILLSSDTGDICRTIDAYSAFAASLYRHGDNFSDYLLKAVLDSENIYITSCCSGKPVSPLLTRCLSEELDILHDISLFDGEIIRSELDYEGFLPCWNVQDYDFAGIYAERMNNLHKQGYGIFAKYHVFTLKDGKLVPVKHPDPQSMKELSGYELERGKVFDNTRALLDGKPASNVLLYGDAGTGKSSTVKAVANELAKDGLRIIEIKKNQLYQIPDIIDGLTVNPLKFILFIDDLSFSSNDNDFAALKAILEGSVNGKSSNIAVYATSNRRHLIKENFSDRNGDEIHLADTMQELMSLSERFGLTITYSRPDKVLYEHIVTNLAAAYGIEIPHDELMIKAEAHALRSGGRSPRVAKQFVEQMKAKQ